MSTVPTTSTGRVRRFLEIRSANYRNRPNVLDRVHEWIGPDAVAHDLTEHDLEALVAEHDATATELARVKAELDARIAVESDAAAAGSYTGRAEKAEAALAEMQKRHDVLGQTRAEIAIELRDAARWHPDNAAWTQDMDQAARIVEIGMDAYAAENGLPRLGGFVRASHCLWCGTPQQLDGDGLVPSHEHPVYFDECPGTHRHPADAIPRTALERAAHEPACTCQPNGGMKYHAVNCGGYSGQLRTADEQGDREGGSA